MSDRDILALQHKRPFEPFRIQVSDGTTYEIRHPEMVIATFSSAYIAIPKSNNPSSSEYDRVERVEIVAMEHIVKLMPLATAEGKAAG